jgi:nitrous oxidase accessory protein NosD
MMPPGMRMTRAGGLAARTILILAAVLAVVPTWARALEPGRTIELRGTHEGDYVVPDGVELVGEPGARVVGRVILGEGSAVRDVEITGWTDRTWNFSGGVMVRGDGATVERCTIHDGPSHGILVIGGFTDARILDNTITHVGSFQKTASKAYPVANWRGISLEAGSDRALVAGNTVEGVWEVGIFEHDSQDVVLRSNTVVRPNAGRVDRFNAGSGSGIESLSPGAVIERNTVDGSGDPSAYGALHGIAVGGEGTQVIGNVVRNVRGSGISVFHGGDGRVIAGNRLDHVAGAVRGEAGIRLFVWDGTDPMLNTVIRGNLIGAVGTGVAIWTGPKGLVDDTRVVENATGGARLELADAHGVIRANDTRGPVPTVTDAPTPLGASTERRLPVGFVIASLFAVAVGVATIAARRLRARESY